MKKIIFDCDNTFGIPSCDVDDGLALLYLLGDKEAEVLAVTTTYGNNLIDVVYPNTKRMLKRIGRGGLPVYKGGEWPGDYESEAAKVLAEMVAKHPLEISVLATGSLTNLEGAFRYNPQFFEQVKEIVLMGGVTEPLIFAKKEMQELNFSCDPLATLHTLKRGNNVSVITGNNCLKVLFTRENYEVNLAKRKEPIARFISKETDYWFVDNEIDYGIGGFYNWDVTAAAYLMHSELFCEHRADYYLSAEDLEYGFLRQEEGGDVTLNLPEIKEAKSFTENIYSHWLNVTI